MTDGTSTELAVAGVGVPRETLDRIQSAKDIIRTGSPGDIIDVLVYMDAMVSIAREKRAVEIAREAAQMRIMAARKLGELIAQAADPDKLWAITPQRFSRCDDLAAVPQKLFDKSIAEILASDGSCTIPAVIRRSRILSLKKIEPNIYQSWDGSYFVTAKGSTRMTHVHYGSLERARYAAGIRSVPGAATLDDAYSRARILSDAISRTTASLTGDARRLTQEAELAQMKVAELLDQAVKALVGTP